jgi:hypothetical protein
MRTFAKKREDDPEWTNLQKHIRQNHKTPFLTHITNERKDILGAIELLLEEEKEK